MLSPLEILKKKIQGKRLDFENLNTLIQYFLKHPDAKIEISAFVTACSTLGLNRQEILSLLYAMVESGEVIDWGLPLVLDKHCIGGIPGNRTTMIVVPIVAAYGLPIPKTSSRAITSPAGTADTMGALSNVSLTLKEMKKTVEAEGACITWGGSLSLAPVDDIMISVERVLNIDSEGQMVASILSKKKAAGATHLLLDIPVGPTAKVCSLYYARRLKNLFEKIGHNIGLKIKGVLSAGVEPVGFGIGPVLEAEDVLKVLRNEREAPTDLKQKSLFLAGELLELSGKVKKNCGLQIASDLLFSGAALEKFLAIVQRQGGLKHLSRAPYRQEIKSLWSGKVHALHNQKIAQVAKLAGSPQAPRAGVLLYKKRGDVIKKGEGLFSIYAETPEELESAQQYAHENTDIYHVR